MDGVKDWYKSKAIIDCLAAILCMILAAVGVAMDEELRALIFENLMIVAAGIGAVVAMADAIRGRYRARDRIKPIV